MAGRQSTGFGHVECQLWVMQIKNAYSYFRILFLKNNLIYEIRTYLCSNMFKFKNVLIKETEHNLNV